MDDALGGRNINSRRLNKDYLQGVENAARTNGGGSLMAGMGASYARSHTNMDTITHYLNDHALTAETAEMVLYFMMERGVLGFSLYQTLLLAYPETLPALPMKTQNEVINMLAVDPLFMELEQSGQYTKLNLQQKFIAGSDAVVKQLTGMFEISQNRGKGKDRGIYCTRRALGEACAYPEHDSCLANVCPYLVFTRNGFGALLDVFRGYLRREYEGDQKSAAVLRNVILPRFKSILNELIRDTHMTQNERQALRAIVKVVQY